MGLVYVFSNPSLHGQLKVGFTFNSINKRLGQLNGVTSIPTKFVVEYYVELEDSETYKIEQAVHADLERAGYHHGKEFFKCSVSDCKDAIATAIAKHNVIVLHAEDAEITRGNVVREKQRIQGEQARAAQESQREQRLAAAEQEIRSRYQQQLDQIADPGRFLHWWMGCTVACAFLVDWIASRGLGPGGFILALIGGAISAVFASGHVENEKRQGSGYLTKVRDMEAEVAGVRGRPAASKPAHSGANRFNAAYHGTDGSANGAASSMTETGTTKIDVIAKWVFDSDNDDLYEIQSNTLFDKRYYQRTPKGFHVLMFKWAEYPEVHFIGRDNPVGTNPRLQDESMTLATMGNIKKSLALRTACDALNAASPGEVAPTCASVTLAPIDHIETPPPRGQAAPVKVATPRPEPQAWGLWLSGQWGNFATHIENFGADMVELAVKQCAKMHWQMHRQSHKAVHMLTQELSDFEEENANFGADMVEFVSDVAQRYFDAHSGIQPSQPNAPDIEAGDIPNYGADTLEMFNKVAKYVFAQNLLKAYRVALVKDDAATTDQASPAQARPVIPFAKGAVVLRINADVLGHGRIIARNGESLVVEFPEVGGRLKLAVATAGDFLHEVSGV